MRGGRKGGDSSRDSLEIYAVVSRMKESDQILPLPTVSIVNGQCGSLTLLQKNPPLLMKSCALFLRPLRLILRMASIAKTQQQSATSR